MARTVLTNAAVKINGLDWSSYIASVEVNIERDDIETTAFGDSGRTRVGGLEDSSISLDFHQNFDPAEVDAAISALIGGTAAFEVLPKGSAVGTANPKFSASLPRSRSPGRCLAWSHAGLPEPQLNRSGDVCSLSARCHK
jgi:hypothetical protein